MKKIEMIWRHILFEVVEKRHVSFRQQDLARVFGISTSTVSLSLTPLRKLGAIKVGGRGFNVVDYEKILYHWANHRSLMTDTKISHHVDLPVKEIEGLLPDDTITTAFTAVGERFGEPPADYDKIYCYHSDPSLVSDRFSPHVSHGLANLFILQSDPYLMQYGNNISLAQIFVDLWNISDWYAKDFTTFVKGKIDELLS